MSSLVWMINQSFEVRGNMVVCSWPNLQLKGQLFDSKIFFSWNAPLWSNCTEDKLLWYYGKGAENLTHFFSLIQKGWSHLYAKQSCGCRVRCNWLHGQWPCNQTWMLVRRAIGYSLDYKGHYIKGDFRPTKNKLTTWWNTKVFWYNQSILVFR